MPSDRPSPSPRPAGAGTPLGEPPSVKLIVRLFLIPLIIVALAVGVMFLIGLIAGSGPSFEEALAGLKNPGGGRTAEWLVGPGAKQRYLYAKTLTDKMKSGLTAAQRITLTSDLIEIVDRHTLPEEGEVQHFLLLAIGRAWQASATDASDPAFHSEEAKASRQQAVATLLRYGQQPNVETRKAAILGLVYLAGYDEVDAAIPFLLGKLGDNAEDLDVRLAAATVLGPVAEASNREAIDALQSAMRDTDPHRVELVWQSALSLAQLGQEDVADTILKLLDRAELSKLEFYDRESDPANPSFRTLSDREQERILINTMIGSQRLLHLPEIRDQIQTISESDPSERVRYAARDILQQHRAASVEK